MAQTLSNLHAENEDQKLTLKKLYFAQTELTRRYNVPLLILRIIIFTDEL